MLIGDGFISKNLQNLIECDGLLIYARGVSNTKKVSQSAYKRDFREFNLFLKQNIFKTLLYLSSSDLSQYHPFNSYLTHKQNMENLALADPRCKVVRLPQITGEGMGKYSLVSYFKSAIKENINMEIWDTPLRYPMRDADLNLFFNKIISQPLPSVTDVRPRHGLAPKEILNLLNPSFKLFTEVKKNLTQANSHEISYLHESIEILSQENYCRNVILSFK